ncbi:MAG: hypothetical protein DRJ97_07975, partial [Thermoprotei archaeon]
MLRSQLLKLMPLLISLTLLVTSASAASLTLMVDRPKYLRGDRVSISGFVSLDGGPAQGVSVGLEVRSPGGAVVWFDQVTTGADGSFSSSFSLNPYAELGVYVVHASSMGAYATASFSVVLPSSLTLEASTDHVKVGEQVVLTGQLNPALKTEVEIYLSNGAGRRKLATVTTSSDGSFTYAWTPEAGGTYVLEAYWPGSDEYMDAESNEVTVTVDRLPSSITCTVSRSRVILGSSITISGRIEPGRQAAVVIEVNLGQGWFKVAEVVSGLDGTYSYRWVPSELGEYRLRTSWPGDQVYYPATSSEVSLSVLLPRITLELSSRTVYVGSQVSLRGRVEPQESGIEVLIQRFVNGQWINEG